MKRFQLQFLVLAASALLVFSCKKYPEGPGISFRSAKQRIMNTWRIESITLNGVEKSKLPEFATAKIFLQGSGVYTRTYIDPGNGVGQRVDGSWQLQDGNKQLSVTQRNLATQQNETTVLYNILKLKENELWLRSVDNSEEMILMDDNQ